MPEASSRVLLDRTVLRLDGRPFLTWGVRLRETAAADLPRVMDELARAGFNTVCGPPVNERNLWYAQALFDEAEKRGQLVVVEADPAHTGAANFLARRFKHRPSLHSYQFPALENNAALHEYSLQRDHLRTFDLFHPIWAPTGRHVDVAQWASAVDMHSVAQRTGGPRPRAEHDDARRQLSHILDVCIEQSVAGRPFFCHSFQCGRSACPPESLAAGSPEADLLRIRTWEVLASRSRGLILDGAEHLLGEMGRDRLCEFALLAREADALHAFFAEGQLVHSEIDTGHPRIQAGMVHHGDDVLILLWRSATGDEYWIDDSVTDRVEVRLKLPVGEGLSAWRVEFPEVKRVQIDHRYKGAPRLLVGRVDLTAAILVTRSGLRADEAVKAIQSRLASACSWQIAGLEARLVKLAHVEGELSNLSATHQPQFYLEKGWRLLSEARGHFDKERMMECWGTVEQARRILRTLVERRMTEALTSARVDRDSDLDLLRRSYYTLPQFHRDVTRKLRIRAALDYT